MTWKPWRIGLIVTGEGEERGMPRFLEALGKEAAKAGGRACIFLAPDGRKGVAHRIHQMRPKTAKPKDAETKAAKGKFLRVVTADGPLAGGPRQLPDDSFVKLVRGAFERELIDFLVLVDDLERDGRGRHVEVCGHYRTTLDHWLGPHAHKASVHFLVLMLENYFFADPTAMNAVLRAAGMREDIPAHEGDPESITDALSRLHVSRIGIKYDKAQHGAAILAALDARAILSDPATCASLRTLFAWCWKAMGLVPPVPGDVFRLRDGVLSDVTRPQLARIASLPTAT